MKKYNQLYNYPIGSGVVKGSYVTNNKNSLVICNHEQKMSISDRSKVNKFVCSLKNYILLRGVVLFFYYIFKLFEGIDKSYDYYNSYLLRQPIETKNKYRNKFKIFYTLVVVFMLLFFVLLPLGANLLFDVLFKSELTNIFFNILFKVIFVLSFFAVLRFVNYSKEIYRKNYAINKVANAYTDNGIDYSKLNNAKGYRVLNPYNIFIVGLVGLYVFIPIVSFEFAMIFNVLIKVGVGVLWLGICYELLYLLQYRYDKCPVARFVSIPFITLSRLTSLPCKKEELDMAINAVEETLLMTKRKNNPSEKHNFRQLYIKVKTELAESGINDPNEADYLICDSLGISKIDMLMLDVVTSSQQKKILKVLEQRKKRIPLNKIFKRQNFYGNDFFINDNVLAPRQDTEILVEQAIKYINEQQSKQKVLDLCTGSGIIAITIATKTNSIVTATDISKLALNVATKNATNLNAKVSFLKSDAFKGLKPSSKFDIIISNPPYIPTQDIQTLSDEVKLHDPIIALDGGKDGLDFYKIIANEAPKHLTKGGVLMLEIGYDQKQSVPELLKDNFKDIQVIDDYGGNPRVVIATKKG